MAKYDKADLERRMVGALESLKHDLTGLRTGRANTALLEPVQVEVYGSMMPLNQVATISAPEPRMLSVQVWDKNNVGPADKAIIATRRLLLEAVEAVRNGCDPRGVGESYYSLRAIERILPRDVDWRVEMAAELYGHVERAAVGAAR